MYSDFLRCNEDCFFGTISQVGVLRLEKESVQVGKRACCSECSSTTLTLAAVLVCLPVYQRRVDIVDVRHDHDEYRGVNVNLEPASVVYFDTLVDENLLWAQGGNSVELSEKTLNATKALVKAVGCFEPVSMKDYKDLINNWQGR